MSPITLLFELVVFTWAGVVLYRQGWKVENPRLVWVMTVGAFLTNVLLLLAFLPIARVEAAKQGLSESVIYGFIIFRAIEWTVLVHVLTRLALSLRKYNLPGGFAFLGEKWRLSRTVLVGVGSGVLAGLIAFVLAKLWVSVGFLDKPIWVMMKEGGVTWQLGVIGGIRNLFSEEVVTRLGVQTLLLYHLRRYRWAPWAAVLLSCLFFEFWHNGMEDLYFLNFAVSLPFAWSFHRFGYETAAIGHCVADWFAIAVVLLL